MGRRIRWLALVLALCFVAVLVQLVNIQLQRAPALNATPSNPRNAVKRFDNDRGLILASNGTVLAKSVPTGEPSGHYEYARVYPTGPLYSGIVGYSSLYYGTSGAEYSYNNYLSLHKRPPQTLGQLLHTPGTTTDDVTLTVVPQLQELAAQQLADVPDTDKDGAVTVLSVKTSSVLAMYSSPDYTNNALATPTPGKDEAAGKADRDDPDHEGFKSYPPMATFDTFAPGSTFKVVTSSAVYNLKKTLENFAFPVAGCTAPGAIPETTRVICNDATTPTEANPCGGTMTQMLPESCDPGYAELGLAVGGTDLYKQAELFGFDQTPKIDLTPTWVSKSNFPTPAELAPQGSLGLPGVAYSAFGQETVTATDLQNAMVAEGIADKGVVMTPHVMADIRNGTGGVVERYQPTVYKDALSARAAASVSKLMQLVAATPIGTAYDVGFPSQWDVAVKTGTAQAGPGNTNTTDWMIGFAPAYDPVVAVSVVVPLQARSASGAEIAGPIMKAMMTAALGLFLHPQSSTTTTTPTTTASNGISGGAPATTIPATAPASTTIPSTTSTTTTSTTTTSTTTTSTTTTTLPPTTTTATPTTTTAATTSVTTADATTTTADTTTTTTPAPLPAAPPSTSAGTAQAAAHSGRPPPPAIRRAPPGTGVLGCAAARPRLGAECSP